MEKASVEPCLQFYLIANNICIVSLSLLYGTAAISTPFPETLKSCISARITGIQGSSCDSNTKKSKTTRNHNQNPFFRSHDMQIDYMPYAFWRNTSLSRTVTAENTGASI